MSANTSTKLTFEKLLTTYLATRNKLGKNELAELEVKFGTRQIKRIKKENFDNVITYLLANGFTFMKDNKYYLSIKADDIRTEIINLINIQNYCKTSTLPSDFPQLGYNFNKKQIYKLADGQSAIFNFDNFNFRVAYSVETEISPTSEEVQNLLKEWHSIKKFNRLINRYSMEHKDYPIRIDLSIVRESSDNGKSFKETNIFKASEKYEIEVELMAEKTEQLSVSNLDVIFKKTSKYILSGLQSTNFPVSYPELKSISQSYMQLVRPYSFDPLEEPQPKDFIGPSSSTLQISNITPKNKDTNIVNVRTDFTVTDKADGDRKLLYITDSGRIYLITTLLNIEFTGAVTENSKIFNTLLDGEHIKHNKNGQFINLYAAFDIYFLNKNDVRTFEFSSLSTKVLPNNQRFHLLTSVINSLEAMLVNTKQLSPIRIERKSFYEVTPTQSIFTACSRINTDINAGQYEYEIDGLIFTPTNLGVGLTKVGQRPKSYKHTWDYSFKWKPAEYNTVDFLIITKKTPTGAEFVGNKFEEGMDTAALDQIVQYKTIILRVGYDVKKHGYLNPCQNIIDGDISQKSDVDNEEGYKPVQFVPSNPYDSTAGITNIELRLDNTNEKQMFTEENEVIEDNTIVEFRYDMDRLKGWRWVPLRVRYDKTSEYRAGYKNYGNAYHVAQSNWHSIHNPITREMLITGEEIPDELQNDDIYYNQKKGPKITKGLRDFHNLFVKNKLITAISNPGDTLIDYAVGKGGDISKWISAKLAFVFGMDLSRDNIRNPIDGVCARYLNYKQKFDSVPDALFIYGDSAKNIRNLSAAYSEVGKTITKAVFGEGPNDENILGRGVVKSYGKGIDGFNISSIQFAVHYMFQSAEILQSFLTNIAECTKLGGYFIGTSFNGKKIFKLLENIQENESYTFYDRDRKDKLLEITKQFNREEFSDNISCVGYGIDVFQASINKTFREYLVNYDYLTSILESYGFVPLNVAEAKEFNLTNSIGSFEQLYDLMGQQIKKNQLNKDSIGQAFKMTREEKNISFLNNYFIYKKVRNVDINDIKSGLSQKTPQQELQEVKASLSAKNVVKAVEEATIVKEITPAEAAKPIEAPSEVTDISSPPPATTVTATVKKTKTKKRPTIVIQ